MRRNVVDWAEERSLRCQEGIYENMEFATSSVVPRFRKHSGALGVDRKIVRFATLTSCNLKTVLRNQMKLFNPNSTHHFLQHIKNRFAFQFSFKASQQVHLGLKCFDKIHFQ